MSTGLGGETGEVLEVLKKRIRDKDLDDNKLVLELGDVLYYLTRISAHFGYSLEDIMYANTNKLIKRRKFGKEQNVTA